MDSLGPHAGGGGKLGQKRVGLLAKEKAAMRNKEGMFPKASTIKIHGPNNVRGGGTINSLTTLVPMHFKNS